MKFKFSIQTLFVLVAVTATALAVFVAIQNQRRASRSAALNSLKAGRVLLLRTNAEPDVIDCAEIWVNESGPDSFKINGVVFTQSNAKTQLTHLRRCLDDLGLPRTVLVDSEPGSQNGRASTTKLVHSAGFVGTGGQSKSDYDTRRQLFEAKKILLE